MASRVLLSGMCRRFRGRDRQGQSLWVTLSGRKTGQGRGGVVGPQKHVKYTGRKYMKALGSNGGLGGYLSLSFFFLDLFYNSHKLYLEWGKY